VLPGDNDEYPINQDDKGLRFQLRQSETTPVTESDKVPPLTVDVVIVTRNRPAALSLSLPLVLKQDCRPQQVIIVDSSDDKGPVKSLVDKASETSDIPLVVMQSPRGIPLQRNTALTRVTADITLFLDDDSLLLPNAISAIMRIYALDREEAIGGVCSREATHAPDSVLNEAKNTYAMKALDTLKLKVAKQRYQLETRLFPDPLYLHGRSRFNVRAAPSWLAAENAVLVEHMTGFRMSFRTKLIKASGFDEVLSGYALGEDIDASFSALGTHLLVGARDAGIFHYKDPGRRDTGTALGVTHVLNNAYIICKHAPADSPARSHLKSFFRYKIALYAMAAKSRFDRERLLGAMRGYKCLHALMDAPASDLSRVYLEMRDKCLTL
jgi:glycosyltransferase involved in cell wall biosynthesis